MWRNGRWCPDRTTIILRHRLLNHILQLIKIKTITLFCYNTSSRLLFPCLSFQYVHVYRSIKVYFRKLLWRKMVLPLPMRSNSWHPRWQSAERPLGMLFRTPMTNFTNMVCLRAGHGQVITFIVVLLCVEVITDPRHNFNSGLSKPTLKFKIQDSNTFIHQKYMISTFIQVSLKLLIWRSLLRQRAAS